MASRPRGWGHALDDAIDAARSVNGPAASTPAGASGAGLRVGRARPVPTPSSSFRSTGSTPSGGTSTTAPARWPWSPAATRASARRWSSRSPPRGPPSSSTGSPTRRPSGGAREQVAALGDKVDRGRGRRQQGRGPRAPNRHDRRDVRRLDVMVNNAGIDTRTSVLETTEEQYDKVLAINLKSAFFGTQLAAKQMIAQGGGGRIINITSVHEDWPMPGNTAYCLSKGGMRMLTRTAGVELAPHGILVVGVGPAPSHADQRRHRGRPRPAGQAQRLHTHRPAGRARGDRQCGGLPGRRRRQLHHRHHHLHRRRHHAVGARGSDRGRQRGLGGTGGPLPARGRLRPIGRPLPPHRTRRVRSAPRVTSGCLPAALPRRHLRHDHAHGHGLHHDQHRHRVRREGLRREIRRKAPEKGRRALP